MSMEKYKPQIKRVAVILMPVFMFWLVVNLFLLVMHIWGPVDRTLFGTMLTGPFVLAFFAIMMFFQLLSWAFSNGLAYYKLETLLCDIFFIAVSIYPVIVGLFLWYKKPDKVSAKFLFCGWVFCGCILIACLMTGLIR